MNNFYKKSLTAKMITLGCKVNQYESDEIIGALQRNGFNPPDPGRKPDLYIINTCTVTHKAAMQSRQAIRKAVRENPDAVILATGCYVQSEPSAISKMDGVDYIIGNSHKHNICEVVNSNNLYKKTSPLLLCQDIPDHLYPEKAGFCSTGNRSRPFIKIQDGCNNFCTYCVVPYTRGPSCSRPLDDIIDEIKYLSLNGVREIVLTGIHIGRYGLDLSPPYSLLSLLNDILKKKNINRIRLSSIEPTELTDDILFLAAESKNICSHFHIPLQSGDKTILKKMNRPYTPEIFNSLIRKIHQLIPEAAIGIDVMVGFPGETDEAFNHTVNLIESLPISYLHIFPFSRRWNTPASRFPDQVPSDIVKSRLNHLRKIGSLKKTNFYRDRIGQTFWVIIESQRDKKTKLLKGVSENYVRVLIEGDDALKNQLIHCKAIKQLESHAVLGKPV